MRHVLPLIAFLCLAFVPAPLPKTAKADSDNDLKLMRGAWFTSETEAACFEGDRLTFTRPNDGKITSSYRVKLDASTRPKQIDLIGGQVPARKDVGDFLHRGIYVIEKETIKICIAFAFEKRPTRFETTQVDLFSDKHWTLSIFKRKKP